MELNARDSAVQAALFASAYPVFGVDWAGSQQPPGWIRKPTHKSWFV